MGETRTLDDVERILGFAKLDKTEMMSTVQCLHFIPDLDNDAFKLMEVDKNVLDTIQDNRRLVVRGGKEDSAVLCTEGKTYDMKEAETSNQLLVLSDCDGADTLRQDEENLKLSHKEVCALKQVYYELRPMRPRLKKLHRLVEENLYAGPDEEKEENHRGNTYTFEELQNQVQASNDEIKAELQKLNACLIDGCWRTLEFDYIGTIFESILDLVKSESWSIDAVPMTTTCDILEDIHPRPIIAHVLQSFSSSDENGKGAKGEEVSEDNNGGYHLSEDKVCRHYAKLLLKQVEKFLLADFERSWQLCVPEEMKTSLYQLNGMALIDRESTPQVVKYFPVTKLSEDVIPRFEELFEEKRKWTKEEILPYIEGLATATVSVGSLLLKNARASTQNGVKVYSSKKIIS